jgi:TolA-binding protein
MYLPLMAVVVAAIVAVYRFAWGAGPRPAAPPAGVVSGFGRTSRRAAYVTGAVAVAVAAVAAWATIERNREYQSRLTMARTIVERYPNGRGHFLLGFELMDAGQENAAIAELRQAKNEYVPGHYGLGVELASVGQYDEAIAELREFVRLMPASGAVVPARELLGRLLIEKGDLQGAREQFTLILDQVPTHARARQYLQGIAGR